MTETNSPLRITFRNMPASPSVEAKIREAAARLDNLGGRTVGCAVIVECSHRKHRQGNLFHVRVDLKIPGAEIVASRDPGLDHTHENVYVAIRDAFDTARRRLQDYVHRDDGGARRHSEAVAAFQPQTVGIE